MATFSYLLFSSFLPVSVFQALQALIWAIFGLTELSNTKVKDEYGHNVTEFIGATMFGAYCIITIVVLLNLLIAMMNDSFQKIQVGGSNEWRASAQHVVVP